MITQTITGKFNTAVCYANTMEDSAKSQIETLCNMSIFKDSKIRIMPDVHSGKGCVVGTTMTITDKIVPFMIGVDIACAIHVAHLVKHTVKGIDYNKLDKVIREKVPSGMSIHAKNEVHRFSDEIDLTELRCAKHVNIDKAERSIGTLGGGNHFIEIDKNKDKEYFLLIHTGSRHLGLEVAEYYQRKAYENLHDHPDLVNPDDNLTDDMLKYVGWLDGTLLENYLYDMNIIKRFADLNRLAIVDIITKSMKLKVDEEFTTIHNYIDTENMILRKGAISAQKDEKVVIPMNMRDGSLICVGKGNPDWNYSAPHGAGRLLSRSDAKNTLSMSKFKSDMKHIFTTSVKNSTIDEAPDAYKPMNEIINQILDTVDIVDTINPVYNFKAD